MAIIIIIINNGVIWRNMYGKIISKYQRNNNNGVIMAMYVIIIMAMVMA